MSDNRHERKWRDPMLLRLRRCIDVIASGEYSQQQLLDLDSIGRGGDIREIGFCHDDTRNTYLEVWRRGLIWQDTDYGWPRVIHVRWLGPNSRFDSTCCNVESGDCGPLCVIGDAIPMPPDWFSDQRVVASERINLSFDATGHIATAIQGVNP